MRDFRNPDFLQKMVDYFHIDHTGTCFAPGVWDPKSLPAEDFYDRCAARRTGRPPRRAQAASVVVAEHGSGEAGQSTSPLCRSVRSCRGRKLTWRASRKGCLSSTLLPSLHAWLSKGVLLTCDN